MNCEEVRSGSSHVEREVTERPREVMVLFNASIRGWDGVATERTAAVGDP